MTARQRRRVSVPWSDGPLSLADLLRQPEPEDVSWRDSALCAQSDGDAWFPEKGGTTRYAKKICRGCPVTTDCLEWALDNGEEFGVWGGMSERERRKLKRNREANAA